MPRQEVEMLSLFRKNPTPSEAARELSRIGHQRNRMMVRARVDQMRKDMGMPPVSWPK